MPAHPQLDPSRMPPLGTRSSSPLSSLHSSGSSSSPPHLAPNQNLQRPPFIAPEVSKLDHLISMVSTNQRQNESRFDAIERGMASGGGFPDVRVAVGRTEPVERGGMAIRGRLTRFKQSAARRVAKSMTADVAAAAAAVALEAEREDTMLEDLSQPNDRLSKGAQDAKLYLKVSATIPLFKRRGTQLAYLQKQTTRKMRELCGVHKKGHWLKPTDQPRIDQLTGQTYLKPDFSADVTSAVNEKVLSKVAEAIYNESKVRDHASS